MFYNLECKMSFPSASIIKLTVGIIITVFGFLLVGKLNVNAQSTEPKIMLTWQTLSYTPPEFKGKALPTTNSPIVASVEVFDTSTGQLINLSDKEIRWYIDGILIKNSPGEQRLIFRAPKVAPKTTKLRVEVPNLNGFSISEVAEIPTVAPEVVIEAPFYNNQFSTYSVTLKSNLYFWNELDPLKLNYEWVVNGHPVESGTSPNVLDINVTPKTNSGYPVMVNLIVSNPQNYEERAFASQNLVFKQ